MFAQINCSWQELGSKEIKGEGQVRPWLSGLGFCVFLHAVTDAPEEPATSIM
jgi:hypothetical protein